MLAKITVFAALTGAIAVGAIALAGGIQESQERERPDQERRIRVPDHHPLPVALEWSEKLNLSNEQLNSLKQLFAEYGPARQRHIERITELKQVVENSEGERRQEAATYIERSSHEFGLYAEQIAHRVAELLNPNQREALHRHVIELNTKGKGGSSQIHPIGMALELQNRLELNEEQVQRLQGMWAEYKQAREHLHVSMAQMKTELESLKSSGATEREMKAAMEQLRNSEMHFHQFAEEAAHAVASTLNPNQREMLHKAMQEYEKSSSSKARSVNPLAGSPVAWALELHEKLGLNEEQVQQLKGAWSGLNAGMKGLQEAMSQLESQMKGLRESGRSEEEAMNELSGAISEIKAAREQIASATHEVVKEVLTEDQLKRLHELMKAGGG